MALDRLAQVVTPLGDKLMLHSVVGREELSRPFSYEITLLSEDTGIKASSLLGQGVTVELDLENDKTRYFNGIVTRFARGVGIGRHAAYSATIRPWLWLLSRTADCRIFQNLSVPDVIKQVFRDHGLTDFDDALSGSYRTWDYIVQYRETTMAFVSRLMEQEGIYYYFRHESGKHTLVLSDGYSAHTTAPGYEEVPYFPPDSHNARERDHLTGWSVSEQIQPGAYMLDDFDFTRPKANLQAKVADPRDHAKADMEIYDYPGEYVEVGDGESYTKARLQALQTQYEQSAGVGNARGMSAGSLFKLTQFPIEDQNREYLIIATQYNIENSTRESDPTGEVHVNVELEARDSRVQYRAAQLTPKPVISGPQTAIVVGKSGEEIWTDQYGRIKVQFHWDRLGKSDENSSCWVRVAQIWAGGRWGGIHIPRIGQEVIVEFLEGDPDRPIVTGRVYNGDNKPPYDLPANQTQSGIKSRSTKGGNPDNFNELRFEDKKGEEQVYLQAEKNMDALVKNDETLTVNHDRTKTIGNDETTTVTGFRTETVKKDEKVTIVGSRTENVGPLEDITIAGDRRESVGATETITIGSSRTESVGADETISIAAARTTTIGSGEVLTVMATRTVTVVGAHAETVGGAQAVTVAGAQATSVAGMQSTSVLGARAVSVVGAQTTAIQGSHTLTVSKDQTVNVTGARSQNVGKDDKLVVGKSLVVSAADDIVLKAGDASITLKKNGDITIKGKNINVTGSGKIKANADGDMILKGSKIAQN
jgi:type VI secretion system secreted protein VgrG